jgi:uncharacterized membrane protein (DUF485 family)
VGESTTGGACVSATEQRREIAPLSNGVSEEPTSSASWERVAAMAEFKALLAAKLKFIVPATIFFLVYYFTLPILVGYAPHLMETKVFGVVNLAYAFALSQFFMAWILAAMYLRAAGRFDEMAKDVVNKSRRG